MTVLDREIINAWDSAEAGGRQLKAMRDKMEKKKH
tara:strand:+ start:904 stop:1008 length:105 start_codon:yes stop_codon:yes gene_type:complete